MSITKAGFSHLKMRIREDTFSCKPYTLFTILFRYYFKIQFLYKRKNFFIRNSAYTSHHVIVLHEGGGSKITSKNTRKTVTIIHYVFLWIKDTTLKKLEETQEVWDSTTLTRRPYHPLKRDSIYNLDEI